MATIQERDLLATILSSVGKEAVNLPNQRITGFLSMRGHAYNHELMVIGRAVNGWLDGVYPNNLRTQSVIRKHAQDAFDSATNPSPWGDGIDPCPMLFVTDLFGSDRAGSNYNTRRSAFWRVIKKVTRGLNIPGVYDNNWPSHLVWSNIYKISPADGGNPNNTLCNLQLEDCLKLLKMEITNYLPKRILFLTGMDWAGPFIADLHGNINARNPVFTYVEAYGTANTSCGHPYRFVVASHPMTQLEDPWVNEVLQVL